MGMSKHTPGPWSFSKRGQRVYGGKNRNIPIAQVRLDDPSWEANGQLMAAAPETLASLGAMVDWVKAALNCKDWHWDGDQREAAELEFATALAVVDKAEGRS